ncbi:phage major capsid protein [Rhodococcus sp. ARC_M5]|uniref:phage major capsid family protein n=1 Tax=Rhodococcus sp. ARC_M5 TaxID=2928851 RepID=UPI001FB4CE39|nr:phage major capsid protein [Rhodococcus sp. ARC_M5]MCJ0893237.1 phage major capsid protein [Rhodococcus sp. ARC_M5]
MRIKLDALRAAIKAADDNSAGSLVERRSALITEGQKVLAELKSLDDPEPEAIEAAKAGADAITRIDGKIEAALKSSDVMHRLGKSNPESGNRYAGVQYLGLTTPGGVKAAAATLVKGMAGPDPMAKALVPAGSATGDIPMIGIYERPDLPTTILDLLPMSPVASHFSYMREVSREDNAGVVAVGEEKPRSDYAIERVEDHLRVVAHLAGPVDKYVLEDSAAVQAFLERRMLHGLRLGIEDAVLVGDGAVSAGPPRVDNVRGILNQSGIQTRPFAVDLLTTLRRAITDLERLGHVARGIVLSPDDWEMLELTRREGDGAFDLGPANLPVDRAKRLVWGVPTVTSNVLPAKTGTVLDTTAIEFVGDGRISVDWNPYAGFSRNEVEVRTETRIGVNLTSPLGVVEVGTRA